MKVMILPHVTIIGTYPGDLGTRKRPGTSCKIEIHFWFKITQYLINSTRFLFQICPRYSFPCARHRHKVSQKNRGVTSD